MDKWKKLSHVIYQCKYHIVWVPKYRYRILKGPVKEFVEGRGVEVGGGDGLGTIILPRPLPEPVISEVLVWPTE